MDRTGTGTLSKFGPQLTFDLSNGRVPVLTSKRVFVRGVIEELLWMISGSTDSRILAAKKVHIWDANGAATGGDLGPVYGFQWRHFGATYVNCETDYTGQGVDQLKEAIEMLRSPSKTSRRILISAWNPPDIPKMALPPCHYSFQFYARDGKLSCLMNQRSADIALGVPFNITFYALLTHIVARATGLEASEFVYNIGDAHIYRNHVGGMAEQLGRSTGEFPTVKIAPGTEGLIDIDSVTAPEICIEGYAPQKRIPFPMAL